MPSYPFIQYCTNVSATLSTAHPSDLIYFYRAGGVDINLRGGGGGSGGGCARQEVVRRRVHACIQYMR